MKLTKSIAVVATLLGLFLAGSAQAALVFVDDMVQAGEEFADGIIAEDDFSAFNSAKGLIDEGGTYWTTTTTYMMDGGRDVFSPSALTYKYRQFDGYADFNYSGAPGPENTYYFVAVMNHTAAYSAGLNDHKVTLYNTGTADPNTVGTKPWEAEWIASSTVAPFWVKSGVSADTTYRTFVSKLEYTAFDTLAVTTWIDPDLSKLEDDAGQVAPFFVKAAGYHWGNNINSVKLSHRTETGGRYDYFGVSSGSPFVPEPATMGLMGLGSLGIAVLRKRRRRRG